MLQGAPFKNKNKKTLAERARQAGLEPPTMRILSSDEEFSIDGLVQPDVEGRESLQVVEKGMQHIIADVISKDDDICAEAEKMCAFTIYLLCC